MTLANVRLLFPLENRLELHQLFMYIFTLTISRLGELPAIFANLQQL